MYIGDSITRVPASKKLGWDHSSGMAASGESRDYAHLLAAKIQQTLPGKKVEVLIDRLGGNTINGRLSAVGQVKAWQPDLVVIQLGEHDHSNLNLNDVRSDYENLITAFDHDTPRPVVLCTGPWCLPNKEGKSNYKGYLLDLQNTMQETCQAHGVPFVSVQDLAEDPACSGFGTDPGVRQHPNDKGHQGYADKLWAAYRKKVGDRPAASPIQAEGSATTKPEVGVYYFDGWSGGTDSFHLREPLKGKFTDREPVWGWHDNTPAIMRQEIDLAANAGISFWCFDWFSPEKGFEKYGVLNHALNLYLQAPNRSRLGFCLMVTNSHGFSVGPKDWSARTAEWIKFFKEPGYVTSNGKPLLIFFSPRILIESFGGPSQVKAAFDQLRRDVRAAGLPGISLAACTRPGPDNHWDDTQLIATVTAAGFDTLTYNYHGVNMQGTGNRQRFSDLIAGSLQVWDHVVERSPLPYIPLLTTGWDRRAWESPDPAAKDKGVYYPDRTPQAVQDFVQDAMQWTARHPDHTPPERLILLYAWNEYGEGGYLTPTKKDGNAYLDAIHRALTN